MDVLSVKKILTIFLLVCLFFILIIFCIVYIWNVEIESGGQLQVTNHTHMDYTSKTVHFESNSDHNHSHVHDEHVHEPEEDSETTVPTYHIKLSGKEHATSGKVLIEQDGVTGFVCSDGFDNSDAAVVCRELGFVKGRTYSLMSSFPYSRYTNLKPFLSELKCTGKETKLEDCLGFHLKNVSKCTWFAAAFCYDDIPYEMRLVNGIMSDSGLVEMKVGGEWGVVCAIRNYDDEVADILCRSMNFTGGFAMERGILGSSSLSKVWVPYVSCLEGTEIKQSILDCSLILNVENVIIDHVEHRNNRYTNEYMACLNKPHSFAAAVQCLL